jgi:hypothetical protein
MSRDEDLARDQRALDAMTGAGGRASVQWEYLIAVLDPRTPMDALGAAGRLGWELVSVTPSPEGYRAYLKRVLQR